MLRKVIIIRAWMGQTNHEKKGLQTLGLTICVYVCCGREANLIFHGFILHWGTTSQGLGKEAVCLGEVSCIA